MKKQPGMAALARRLRTARIEAGIETSEQAARIAGVRSGVYWRHEHGENMPTITHAKMYAKAFGVSACWLAFGT